MREKGERVRVLSQGRKGGGRILIQTESVLNLIKLRNCTMFFIQKFKSGGKVISYCTTMISPIDFANFLVKFANIEKHYNVVFSAATNFHPLMMSNSTVSWTDFITRSSKISFRFHDHTVMPHFLAKRNIFNSNL